MSTTKQRRTHAEMSDATRAALLSHAREAFATAGYVKTSLDDIVTAVGATKGALYHHFDGKLALFEAVVRDIYAELDAASPLGVELGGDPWHNLIETCRGYLRGLLDAGTRRILLVEAPAVLGAERERALDHELTVRPLVEWFTALHDRGVIASGDPEALARLVNGALTAIALWMGESKHPERELERGVRALAELLRPPPP
ncbi:MAG: TetR/AcrR family transcriptional regulator [Kofleriaceae bacterium]|nr:TetR/AcrR family transcriptional regulator [Kofleriaceae bacterium]